MQDNSFDCTFSQGKSRMRILMNMLRSKTGLLFEIILTRLRIFKSDEYIRKCNTKFKGTYELCSEDENSSDYSLSTQFCKFPEKRPESPDPIYKSDLKLQKIRRIEYYDNINVDNSNCNTNNINKFSSADVLYNSKSLVKFDVEKLEWLRSFFIDNIVIVITDIVNSTSQWNLYSEDMHKSIKLHNELSRKLIRTFGGYESRNDGDSFFAVFKDSESAIKYALNFQNGLLYQNWPDTIVNHNKELYNDSNTPIYRGISIRIGIHTGKCTVCCFDRKLKYFGKTVDEAYALSEMAKGGETFISNQVFKGIKSKEFISTFNVIQKRAYQEKGFYIYHPHHISRFLECI
ncbi:hypothetical protein LUQ84_000537 [Hamiltosporidium tvaerminnensis]|nr:hypothetical protein LUQ84_000537 [Hamiltosporidium tvaerminnensis]